MSASVSFAQLDWQHRVDSSHSPSAGVRLLTPSKRAHWQTVPGGTRICRVIALLPTMPSTEYAKVPALPLVNVNVADPTSLLTIFPGSKGTALNAGPVVRFSTLPYVL